MVNANQVKTMKHPAIADIIATQHMLCVGFDNRSLYLRKTNRLSIGQKTETIVTFNEDEKIIAGLNGVVSKKAFILDSIWVHEDYRNIFVGRRMLVQAQAYYEKKGLTLKIYPHLKVYEPYLSKISCAWEMLSFLDLSDDLKRCYGFKGDPHVR